MNRSLVPFLTCLLCALPWAHAQDAPTAYVESDGIATITVVPNQVVFWLHFEATENSVADAMSIVDGFDNRLNNELQVQNLVPVELEFTPPSITNLKRHTVYTGARLVFPMGNFHNPDQGPRLFAQLCDKLLDIAGIVGADISGPAFEIRDKDTVIRDAVSAATERAYPPAESVARTLKSAIWAIDTVRVLDVTWNEPLFAPNPEPNMRQISCTAHVRITYSLVEQS